jgi:hypothetical protein
VAAPSEPQTSPARAWAACVLLVLAAAVMVVGLLALGSEAGADLARVVAPAVLLAAAAAALV